MTGRLNRAEVVATGGTEPRSLADLAEKVLGVNANTGKNLIINGDFSIWQRGTSQTGTTYGSDDRWRNDHSNSTKVHTQESFTIGQTDVPNNPKYFSRTVATSVAGDNSYVLKKTELENVRVTTGKEVTLSFWAKADAAKDIAVEFLQNFGTGGSPSASVPSIGVTTFSLTTSWQKFTTTATFPSISGKTLGTNDNSSYQVYFWFEAGSTYDARTNSLGQQSGTFDLANVQLEFGDTATEFEYVHPADQLARCKRYFERLTYKNNTCITTGQCTSDVTCISTLNFSTKRALPAFTTSGGTIQTLNATGGLIASTVVGYAPSSTAGLDNVRLQITVAGGLVAGNASSVFTNSTINIDIDAEL